MDIATQMEQDDRALAALRQTFKTTRIPMKYELTSDPWLMPGIARRIAVGLPPTATDEDLLASEKAARYTAVGLPKAATNEELLDAEKAARDEAEEQRRTELIAGLDKATAAAAELEAKRKAQVAELREMEAARDEALAAAEAARKELAEALAAADAAKFADGQKESRIAELEARVAELEALLAEAQAALDMAHKRLRTLEEELSEAKAAAEAMAVAAVVAEPRGDDGARLDLASLQRLTELISGLDKATAAEIAHEVADAAVLFDEKKKEDSTELKIESLADQLREREKKRRDGEIKEEAKEREDEAKEREDEAKEAEKQRIQADLAKKAELEKVNAQLKAQRAQGIAQDLAPAAAEEVKLRKEELALMQGLADPDDPAQYGGPNEAGTEWVEEEMPPHIAADMMKAMTWKAKQNEIKKEWELEAAARKQRSVKASGFPWRHPRLGAPRDVHSNSPHGASVRDELFWAAPDEPEPEFTAFHWLDEAAQARAEAALAAKKRAADPRWARNLAVRPENVSAVSRLQKEKVMQEVQRAAEKRAAEPPEASGSAAPPRQGWAEGEPKTPQKSGLVHVQSDEDPAPPSPHSRHTGATIRWSSAVFAPAQG